MSGMLKGSKIDVYKRQGKKIMDDIRKIIYEMNNAEKELITQRDMNTKASANVTFNIIIYGTFFAVIFLILIGIIITRCV